MFISYRVTSNNDPLSNNSPQSKITLNIHSMLFLPSATVANWDNAYSTILPGILAPVIVKLVKIIPVITFRRYYHKNCCK